MSLRPYQQSAADAAIEWMRKSVDPAVIEAATGAGKSHIIASVAGAIHQRTGKRVLCLAPSAELVLQNLEKYRADGYQASIYSASAGAKDLRFPVVFGTPLTVKNKISAFKREGDDGYALVILDEAHGITPTIKGIIEQMREGNPRLRVLGLTATPYRLGDGYIFATRPNGEAVPTKQAKRPYFTKLLCRITAPELIGMGFLTPPLIGSINVTKYDTALMQTNARGQFDKADVDRAYHGHGRQTAAIMHDVVAQSQGRKGVLIFAATVRHAEEALASLPPDLSALVTGDTPAAARRKMLADFKAQRLKYMVNVAVLTTGFDAPHVDVVAVLRKTESPGLYQQVIGRGLRSADGKADCLILDYTSNQEDHFPDGDIFDPKVEASNDPGGTVPISCPQCSAVNQVVLNPAVCADASSMDDNGYMMDAAGSPVMSEFGPVPGHLTRRCGGLVRTGGNGEHTRCAYMWTYKPCPECEEPNDIAARYCKSCRTEIVNPNDKLILNYRMRKLDPAQVQTDEVVTMTCKRSISQAGNPTLRVDFVTPWRAFAVWLMENPKNNKQAQALSNFERNTQGGETKPQTITYRKSVTGFYDVIAYNQPADQGPAKCA